MTKIACLAGAAVAALMAASAAAQTTPITSQSATQAYLAQIKARNPVLHAVIAVNPAATADAKALDAERQAGKVRSAIHGRVMLLKDNIETADDLATTAGSLALKNNVTHRDAPLAKRLRDAGVVILGKANLSEWANIRSSHSISG
ncbi:MAG: amidase family protein, partial [bacterium]|nr:amidase family protein [bacterium]